MPIPVFYEEGTGEVLATAESIEHVAALVEREGTDVWWERPVEELLAPAYRANGKTYTKGEVSQSRTYACKRSMPSLWSSLPPRGKGMRVPPAPSRARDCIGQGAL